MGSTKESKIDRETATQEFISYCKNNDLDCDISTMTEDERKDFEPVQNRFIKACMAGRVTVDGTSIDYTPSGFTVSPFNETVKIKRPTAHAFVGMDGYKEAQGVHKMNGFLSAMTGKEVAYFTKIDISDWLFFRDVATLFLAG
jgi:hypothetical protein